MSTDTHIISDEPVALAGAGLSLAGPRDFFQLMKPRVMSLVIFTAIIGLLVAPGSLPLYNSVMAIFCIAVGAGASGALNMWYDADIDAQMTRTKKRPLPRGVMAPGTALTFGFLLSVVSVWMLALATNYVAAALLAFTIFFYVVIYTMWLKRRTPQNIVIGGAPGALPPMIGYAAVTGTVTVDSLILFLIIFIWTPPHFWALALYKLSDYGRVGIPMMPNVAGPKSTKNQMFGYALGLAAVAAAPVITGLSGAIYAFGALLLNASFVALTFKVWRSRAGEKDEVQPESLYEVQKGDRDARNLFAFSILYLFAMFALIGVDYLLRVSS
jgi:protoheme IX farnesyltransferase